MDVVRVDKMKPPIVVPIGTAHEQSQAGSLREFLLPGTEPRRKRAQDARRRAEDEMLLAGLL
jgi:hypothetical protein